MFSPVIKFFGCPLSSSSLVLIWPVRNLANNLWIVFSPCTEPGQHLSSVFFVKVVFFHFSSKYQNLRHSNTISHKSIEWCCTIYIRLCLTIKHTGSILVELFVCMHFHRFHSGRMRVARALCDISYLGTKCNYQMWTKTKHKKIVSRYSK